jgi:hypothetical protein
MFPLLQLDAAVCGWSWSGGGQKLLINKDISVLGKNSSGQVSSLDICRSTCKVERHVDNSRPIINRHPLSCVVFDPFFTRNTDISLVAHRHSYQGTATDG